MKKYIVSKDILDILKQASDFFNHVEIKGGNNINGMFQGLVRLEGAIAQIEKNEFIEKESPDEETKE